MQLLYCRGDGTWNWSVDLNSENKFGMWIGNEVSLRCDTGADNVTYMLPSWNINEISKV